MKKSIKKLFALVTMVCLCAAMAMPTFAANDTSLQEAGQHVVYRWEPCGICNVGMTQYTHSYGIWNDRGTTGCSKYNNLLDIVQERIVYEWVTCSNSNCALSRNPELVRTYTESRVVCNH